MILLGVGAASADSRVRGTPWYSPYSPRAPTDASCSGLASSSITIATLPSWSRNGAGRRSSASTTMSSMSSSVGSNGRRAASPARRPQAVRAATSSSRIGRTWRPRSTGGRGRRTGAGSPTGSGRQATRRGRTAPSGRGGPARCGPARGSPRASKPHGLTIAMSSSNQPQYDSRSASRDDARDELRELAGERRAIDLVDQVAERGGDLVAGDGAEDRPVPLLEGDAARRGPRAPPSNSSTFSSPMPAR